jgi:hypothetical protein
MVQKFLSQLYQVLTEKMVDIQLQVSSLIAKLTS